MKKILITTLALLSSTVLNAGNEIDEDKYRALCKAGDGEKCYKLGDFYAQGKDAEGRPDYYEAVKYYKLSCKRHYAKGCYKYGKCFETGKALPRNENKKLKLLTQSCKEGYSKACHLIEEEKKNRKK